jgi:O-antigen ligase
MIARYPKIERLLTTIRVWDMNQWSDAVGFCGLFLAAYGMFFKRYIAHAGFLLMVLSWGFTLRALGRELIRDKLFLLSVVFALFLVLRTGVALVEFREYHSEIVRGMLKLVGVGFFLVYVFAYWLFRAKGRWNEVILTVWVGFLVQILWKLDWSHLPETLHLYWTGVKRAKFGTSINRFGLWSAVVLLSCLLLFGPMWRSAASRWASGAIRVFWIIMCSVSMMGVVFSQSRAAWLAVAVVFPPVMIYYLYRVNHLKVRSLALIAVLLIMAASLTNFPQIFNQRITADIDSYVDIIFDSDEIDVTRGSGNVQSISQRLLIFKLFWEKYMDRPVWGYGPGASHMLMSNATAEYAPITRYSHFHNAIFEVLIQLGGVGLLFYACFFSLIIQQLWKGRCGGHIDTEYFLLTIGALALTAVGSMFGQPLTDTKGIYLIGFLGGICYSFRFVSAGSPVGRKKPL